MKRSSLAWIVGTVLATAAALVAFHYWAKPYLNVESEGTVQVPPEKVVEVASTVSQQRLEKSVRTLAGFGSRLSGSAGAEQAAAWLAGELRGILGDGSVTTETVDIANPFDLGTEMVAGGASFRAHPFWAPVNGTYRLPGGGRSLGSAARATFLELAAGSGRLSGSVAVVPVPALEDMREVVLIAAKRKAFDRKLRDPLIKLEKELLKRAPKVLERSDEDRRILDMMLEKHQGMLTDFLFTRIEASGVSAVVFVEPAGEKAFRVAPRTFHDRILKHPSRVARYLVSRANAGALSDGTAVSVRPARSAVTLKASGEQLRVYPLWPNNVRPSSTPRGGLAGRLVYVGRASLQEAKGKVLKDSIALVDFNCGYQWVGMADLGAKAILFVEPGEIMRGESENKYLSLPAALPRYWVPRDVAERLKSMEGAEVRIDSQVVWESRPSTIVVGKIKGTRPDADEAPVVIEAYYDSVSVVPEIAPGSEQACGAAALLEIARVLKRYPLKKTVLFVLNPGHCQNMEGWKEWLHRHYASILDRNKRKKVDPEFVRPAFVVTLDLSTHSRRLAVFYKAYRYNHNEEPIRRVYSNFGKYHASVGQEASKRLGYGEAFMADAVNAVAGRTWDSYVPGRFALAQEVVVNAGLYGIAYMTPDDERTWVDTPHDTPARTDYESLAMQTRVLATTLPNVLNLGAEFGSAKVVNYWTTLKCRVVEFDPRVAWLPDRTINGAMVWVHGWVPSKSMKGVRGDYYKMAKGASEQGGATFEIHGHAHSNWLASGWEAHMVCDAYDVDPMDGEVRYAPDRGPQGTAQYTNETDMNETSKNLMLVAFPCRSLLMFDLVDPLRYWTFNWMNTMNAVTNSAPPVYGAAMPEQNWFVSWVEPLAVGFAREGMKLKFTFWASMVGKRGVLINATEKDPEGTGFLVGDPDRLNFTAMRMASDMTILNEFRIAKLKKFGIVNHYLDALHSESIEHFKAAKKALKALDYREAASEARAAWGLACRVYPEVDSMTTDAVKSAMFYLALLIPFAFVAERLLIAFPDATRQVGAAVGLFMAMFFGLKAVHPAFSLALTPLMILVAFAVIALSVIFSGIIGSRFFNFLRQSRESMQGVHKSDVSQVSVGMAAFSIGVSNLRKRVLRTVLTSITLIVLTFAVLSLTSVLTAVKQRKFSIGKKAPYEGLLFRQTAWTPLSEPALRNLETELGGRAKAVPRSWFVSYQSDRQIAVEIVHGDRNRATAVAAMGMTSDEAKVTRANEALVAGEWLRPGDSRAVILPYKLAATLFITAKDVGTAQVVIFGVPFTVRGLFDPKIIGKIRDLDDEEITPVNFEATQRRRQNENMTVQQQEGQLPQRYDHHEASQVIIMPHETLMRLGGKLSTIAIPMKDSRMVEGAITGLLRRLGLLVYVGLNGKTYAYSAIPGSTAGGLDFLVVPILVAALIVFSTMLNAVQERTREIGVFSSVGLAPRHVGILFLAEATVFALIGAVIGYLIGQVFSQLIVHGWVLKGLNVNYSSGSAIMTMFIILGVVLLSTAYPAMLATRLARPSKVTGFTFPPVAGDEVRLELPFSFNARDAQAITAFLAEYFDAHAEASAGEFSAGNITLREVKDGRANAWQMSARVWLAPYDFGVSQDMVFQTKEGIGDESSAGLVITRQSGDQASWRRVNQRFMKSIRKQFLIWRALGETARANYLKRARQEAAKGAAHAQA